MQADDIGMSAILPSETFAVSQRRALICDRYSLDPFQSFAPAVEWVRHQPSRLMGLDSLRAKTMQFLDRKRAYYFRRIESDRGGELDKLDYIDSTLAALDSRNE